MRESRPYGSVRGARDETHVPTATHAICRTICPQSALLLPLIQMSFLSERARLLGADHRLGSDRMPKSLMIAIS
jgi:hypothetical protein